MQQLRQQRIGPQPIGIKVGIGRGAEIGATEPGDRLRRGRLLGDEVARCRHVDAGEHRIGKRFIQFGDQPVLGIAAEFGQLDPELLGQADQQRAADMAFVALDQVEIARRNPGATGERRLRHAQRPPA